jgi:hypothetical protein
MSGLNWNWILLGLLVPLPVGVLLAWPFWRKRQSILGNLTGSVVIFGTAFALILREHAELDLIIQRCLNEGAFCWPQPSAFARYAIYAFIGLAQVMLLFSVSLIVERRVRRSDYAPEWR